MSLLMHNKADENDHQMTINVKLIFLDEKCIMIQIAFKHDPKVETNEGIQT